MSGLWGRIGAVVRASKDKGVVRDLEDCDITPHAGLVSLGLELIELFVPEKNPVSVTLDFLVKGSEGARRVDLAQ